MLGHGLGLNGLTFCHFDTTFGLGQLHPPFGDDVLVLSHQMLRIVERPMLPITSRKRHSCEGEQRQNDVNHFATLWTRCAWAVGGVMAFRLHVLVQPYACLRRD